MILVFRSVDKPKLMNKRNPGRIANKAVAERFKQPDRSRRDMIGLWIQQGVTQTEVETESMLPV